MEYPFWDHETPSPPSLGISWLKKIFFAYQVFLDEPAPSPHFQKRCYVSEFTINRYYFPLLFNISEPLPLYNYRKQLIIHKIKLNAVTSIHHDFNAIKECLKFDPHTKLFSGKNLPSFLASFYLKVDSTICKVWISKN